MPGAIPALAPRIKDSIMAAFSELHITVQEMLRDGWNPSAIARYMQIPIEWVLDVEDSYYCAPDADAYADADAEAYGNS